MDLLSLIIGIATSDPKANKERAEKLEKLRKDATARAEQDNQILDFRVSDGTTEENAGGVVIEIDWKGSPQDSPTLKLWRGDSNGRGGVHLYYERDSHPLRYLDNKNIHDRDIFTYQAWIETVPPELADVQENVQKLNVSRRKKTHLVRQVPALPPAHGETLSQITSFNIFNRVIGDRICVEIEITWRKNECSEPTLYLFKHSGEALSSPDEVENAQGRRRLNLAVDGETLRFSDMDVEENRVYYYYAWIQSSGRKFDFKIKASLAKAEPAPPPTILDEVTGTVEQMLTAKATLKEIEDTLLKVANEKGLPSREIEMARALVYRKRGIKK